ncbi:MAG: NYN domain-containing protein [Planctomycetota bacterium]
MRLLIDGYNLLHATHVFGEGELAGTLQGAREALLTVLADHLPDGLRRATLVVFDAADAPPGVPDSANWRGLAIRYARGYADADSLLEEVIEACRGPRQLLVVSSDHRIQRAARRRGSAWTDSEPWWRALLAQPAQASCRGGVAPDSKPTPKGEDSGADYWIQQFSDPDFLGELSRTSQPPQPESSIRPSQPRSKSPAPEEPDPTLFFPPGYADDLAAEYDQADRELKGQSPDAD